MFLFCLKRGNSAAAMACFYFVLSAAILPLPWHKPDAYLKTLRWFFAKI